MNAALARMCALHPELFECLLSGDVTAHAESIALLSAIASATRLVADLPDQPCT